MSHTLLQSCSILSITDQYRSGAHAGGGGAGGGGSNNPLAVRHWYRCSYYSVIYVHQFPIILLFLFFSFVTIFPSVLQKRRSVREEMSTECGGLRYVKHQQHHQPHLRRSAQHRVPEKPHQATHYRGMTYFP